VLPNQRDANKARLRREEPLNINWLNDQDHFRTALHISSMNGHLETVRLLLAHPEIEVNVQDSDGSSALLLATHRGKTEVVHLLLKDLRVACNLPDSNGCTPLWWAARWSRMEVLEWMVASGREIHLDTPGYMEGKLYKPW